MDCTTTTTTATVRRFHHILVQGHLCAKRARHAVPYTICALCEISVYIVRKYTKYCCANVLGQHTNTYLLCWCLFSGDGRRWRYRLLSIDCAKNAAAASNQTDCPEVHMEQQHVAAGAGSAAGSASAAATAALLLIVVIQDDDGPAATIRRL